MAAWVHGGWIVTPYTGSELAQVHMAFGDRQPGEWKPAYLDYADGQRVGKVGLPEPTGKPARVWLRVNGVATPVGTVSL